MYDEIWAVDTERVSAFFGEDCDGVTVIAMPERQLSSMSIPQTRIIIEGEDADELYHRFYLSFMTAGG